MRLSAVLTLGLSAAALALPAANPKADPVADALAEPAPEELDDYDWGFADFEVEDEPEDDSEWGLVEDEAEEDSEWGNVKARETIDDSANVDIEADLADDSGSGAIEARSFAFTHCTVTASALKYRTCPSTKCTVVGQYKKGKKLKTKFALLGNSDKWRHLENGYHVSAKYCKPSW